MIIKMFTSQLIIIAFCLASISAYTPFDWQDCSSPEAPVKFHNLSFTPNPVSFGETGFLNKTVVISSQLPTDLTINVEVWRGFRLFDYIPFDLKLPCVFGKYCSVRLCEAMEMSYYECMIASNSTENCSACPIKAGVSTVINEELTIPSINTWASWFSAGVYTGRFTLTNDNGDQLACLMVTGEVI